MERLRRRAPGQVADGLLAAGVAVFALLEVFTFNAVGGSHTVTAIVAVAAAAALPLRRRAPLAVAVWVAALLGLPALIGHPADSFSLFVVSLLVAYAVGADAAHPASVASGICALVGGSFLATVMNHGRFADYAYSAVLYTLAAADGRIVRRQTSRVTAAEGLVSRLDRAQEETVQRALSDERGRIAREMHDVISHSVSLMVIQAGAAEASLGREPESVSSALATIQDVGSEAVTELRRLLGVLRDGSDAELLTPQPSVRRIAELIETNRAAGLTIEVHLSGDDRRLPPGVDAAAYRIVQEALTNVRKHAPGSRVVVTIAFKRAELQVAIEDDGPGLGDDVGLGHGLVGMKERAEIYGGRLVLGASPSGGLCLTAALPITEAAR